MLQRFLGKRLVSSSTKVRFRRSDATVSQVPPLGCDLCLELYRGRATKPFLVLIVEVQLGLKRQKPFSWFAYQACQHYRARAPAILLVVTNDRKIARWAAGPFHSGQTTLRPLVLGPDDIPAITDVEVAKRSIPMTFVSGIVPGITVGRERTAVRIGLALAHALQGSDDDGLGIYWDAFLASLSKAVRKELEMEVRVHVSENWRPRSDWGKDIFAKGEAKGEAKGRAEGEAVGEVKGTTAGIAKAILTVLDARGLPVTPALRTRVHNANDLPLLERWLRRATTASSVDEAFAL